MVGVRVGPPRPGKREDRSQSIGLKEFKKPLAEVTVVGLLPGASAAIAVVRWTNPAGRFKTLDPASMQILLLEELPHMAGGSSRQAGIPHGRHLLTVHAAARHPASLRPTRAQRAASTSHATCAQLFAACAGV
jgi:hypothetical protein